MVYIYIHIKLYILYTHICQKNQPKCRVDIPVPWILWVCCISQCIIWPAHNRIQDQQELGYLQVTDECEIYVCRPRKNPVGGQTVMIKSYIRDQVLVQMLQQRIPPKILWQIFLQWQWMVSLVSALYTNVVDHVDLTYDIHHALASPPKKLIRQPPSLSGSIAPAVWFMERGVRTILRSTGFRLRLRCLIVFMVIIEVMMRKRVQAQQDLDLLGFMVQFWLGFYLWWMLFN